MTSVIESSLGSYVAVRLEPVPAVRFEEVLAAVGRRGRIARRGPRLALVASVTFSAAVVAVAVALAVGATAGPSRPAVSPASRPTIKPRPIFKPQRSSIPPRYGIVCGSVLVGGGIDDPTPDLRGHACPARYGETGHPTTVTLRSTVRITGGHGTTYLAYVNAAGLWRATLRAGVYHAVGPGCLGRGERFVVKAGQIATAEVFADCGVG